MITSLLTGLIFLTGWAVIGVVLEWFVQYFCYHNARFYLMDRPSRYLVMAAGPTVLLTYVPDLLTIVSKRWNDRRDKIVAKRRAKRSIQQIVTETFMRFLTEYDHKNKKELEFYGRALKRTKRFIEDLAVAPLVSIQPLEQPTAYAFPTKEDQTTKKNKIMIEATTAKLKTYNPLVKDFDPIAAVDRVFADIERDVFSSIIEIVRGSEEVFDLEGQGNRLLQEINRVAISRQNKTLIPKPTILVMSGTSVAKHFGFTPATSATPWFQRYGSWVGYDVFASDMLMQDEIFLLTATKENYGSGFIYLPYVLVQLLMTIDSKKDEQGRHAGEMIPGTERYLFCTRRAIVKDYNGGDKFIRFKVAS